MELLIPEFGLVFWIILLFLPMVIALISIVKNDFKDSTTKLIWVVIVLFFPLIGSILYLLIGRNQVLKNN